MHVLCMFMKSLGLYVKVKGLTLTNCAFTICVFADYERQLLSSSSL